MISHKDVIRYFDDIEFYSVKYPGEYEPVSIKDAQEIMKKYDVNFFKPKDLKYVWEHEDKIRRWIKDYKK